MLTDIKHNDIFVKREVVEMKWSLLFESEEELLQKLSEIDVNAFHELCDKKICSGYQSITTLVRRVNSGQPLVECQLNSLKRQALQVRIYHEYMGTLE